MRFIDLVHDHLPPICLFYFPNGFVILKLNTTYILANVLLISSKSMLISNFLVLRMTWKREQNIMIDRYGPYGVPLFLCIWDYNLALYSYFHIFF